MAYTKDTIPRGHTEFGGGPGLIDPESRADRALTPEERLLEIYATNPAPPAEAHGATEAAREARAARIEVENDPTRVPLDYPNRGR